MKKSATRKKAAARTCTRVPRPCAERLTASSTASRPKRVVNLMMGFRATDEVSLKGSPTVSPTIEASCRAVPFMCRSTSTTFFALSHAPPAFAM